MVELPVATNRQQGMISTSLSRDVPAVCDRMYAAKFYSAMAKLWEVP
jgi:hypothetical protein